MFEIARRDRDEAEAVVGVRNFRAKARGLCDHLSHLLEAAESQQHERQKPVRGQARSRALDRALGEDECPIEITRLERAAGFFGNSSGSRLAESLPGNALEEVQTRLLG